MKRFFARLIMSLMVIFSLTIASPANAQLIADSSLSSAATTAAETVKDIVTQLETEFLPKLENILSPEQREQFSSLVGQGGSFRKAFKSITLTPDQKTQLKSLLSSLPKKDAFASLTPEQKKKLFMKKKEFFKPTPDEITEKINQGMKVKGTALPEGIGEQISAKLQGLKKLLPE